MHSGSPQNSRVCPKCSRVRISNSRPRAARSPQDNSDLFHGSMTVGLESKAIYGEDEEMHGGGRSEHLQATHRQGAGVTLKSKRHRAK